MKIIVGLGNKGKEYDGTRHNAGFMFVDSFVKNNEISSGEEIIQFHTEKKFESDVIETKIDSEKIIFVKPQTYMNASGKAVASILSFYKVEPQDLIVVMDDVDLPIGRVRIRKEGSSGGHKGIQNIIDSIKSDAFIRIRIGISGDIKKENNLETAQYVLDKFSKRESPILQKTIDAIIDNLIPHIKNKTDIPCHTFDVVAKEQSIEK